MTWARLDDAWTDRPVLESLSYEARWHYLALVVFCSRTSRYDGQVRAADARRCSDVPDPASALQELLAAGLVVPAEGGYQLPQIAEHVPPPHMRDEERKAAQRLRKQRSRAHAAGDHGSCLDDCPARTVTGDVTRDAGTGRDGTGRDQGTGQKQDAWPRVAAIPRADHDQAETHAGTREPEPPAPEPPPTPAVSAPSSLHGINPDGWEYSGARCSTCGDLLARVRECGGHATCGPCDLVGVDLNPSELLQQGIG